MHMLDSKYLEFRVYKQNPKTNIYEVLSKLHGIRLGFIKWYGVWRCYSFFPEDCTIFNSSCLQDIINFITNLKNVN